MPHCLWDPSSPTRDWTPGRRQWKHKSYPLDCQGIPHFYFLYEINASSISGEHLHLNLRIELWIMIHFGNICLRRISVIISLSVENSQGQSCHQPQDTVICIQNVLKMTLIIWLEISFFFFLRFLIFWCGPFLNHSIRLHWICYNVASVLCFGFLAMRHVGS